MRQFTSGLYPWFPNKSKADRELKSLIHNFSKDIFSWRKKYIMAGADENRCREQIISNIINALNDEQVPLICEHIELKETSTI
jgi:hypothetical protein